MLLLLGIIADFAGFVELLLEVGDVDFLALGNG
jgi:hypothetical protein